MANHWKALTALGLDVAKVVELGPYKITERADVALASVAMRRGEDKAFAAAAQKAGVALPEPARAVDGTPYSSFWVAPEMWFVEAPYASHEDIVAHLKPAFGETASITEQTDAWVRFDLAGAGLGALLERLSNVDFDKAPDGFASRTMMEHLGVYLLKRSAQDVTLYGPRSSAAGLFHAIEVAAKSIL